MRNVCPAVWIAAALLAAGGCSHAGRPANPQQTPAAGKLHPRTAGPSTGEAPTQRPAPETTVTASAQEASAASSNQPLATLPPPPRKVPRLAPDAAPQILDVAVSETTVQPGDRVVGRVVTSSNVASVEARIGGYAVNLVKVGVGRFELTYTVGPLPWFIRGNFNMQVIARNTRGHIVTRAIPLTVR